MSSWFKLRGSIQSTSSTILVFIGFSFTIAVWWILAELFSEQRPIIEGYNTILPSSIDSLNTINRDSILRLDSINLANATEFEKVYPLLPRPDHVLFSFPSLIQKDKLVFNLFHSIWLNVQGYFWAILLALPLGFLIGLFPIFRSMFSKQVDALRYLPLSALTGLFIIWFGLGDPMKIAFLAVGILVYLIPVVVSRIDEVEDVYMQTAFTMGASKWQQIKNVFLPGVLTRLVDDIRVLTAISWTYIIIAELLNKESGIGSLMYTKARQGQIDKVFALLVVIILVGLVQDKLFALFDRMINPHKYYKTKETGLTEGLLGFYSILAGVVLGIVAQQYTSFSFLEIVAWICFAAGIIFILYASFRLTKVSVK
ncbi:MAG: ABC transporter permease subunit [Bacteroidota bacterium]|nr:ABC transporter permease subunit [Bacteroidota bacterium]